MVVAQIDPELCVGCQACVGVCPSGAISYNKEEDICEVNQALCKGCGTCAAPCPSECITLPGFSHKQIYTQIDEALKEMRLARDEAVGGYPEKLRRTGATRVNLWTSHSNRRSSPLGVKPRGLAVEGRKHR